MAKMTFKPNANFHKIMNDLDQYRDFCVTYGRVFDEGTLYNERDRNFHDFNKFKERGYAKNHWDWAHQTDRKPFVKREGWTPRPNSGGPRPAGGYNNNYRTRSN